MPQPVQIRTATWRHRLQCCSLSFSEICNLALDIAGPLLWHLRKWTQEIRDCVTGQVFKLWEGWTSWQKSPYLAWAQSSHQQKAVRANWPFIPRAELIPGAGSSRRAPLPSPLASLRCCGIRAGPSLAQLLGIMLRMKTIKLGREPAPNPDLIFAPSVHYSALFPGHLFYPSNQPGRAHWPAAC